MSENVKCCLANSDIICGHWAAPQSKPRQRIQPTEWRIQLSIAESSPMHSRSGWKGFFRITKYHGYKMESLFSMWPPLSSFWLICWTNLSRGEYWNLEITAVSLGLKAKRQIFSSALIFAGTANFFFPTWKLVVVAYSDHWDTWGTHLEHPETVVFGVLFEPSIRPDIQGA